MAGDAISVGGPISLRAQALEVAACIRLGHRYRADHLAGDHLGEKALFDLLAAIAQQVGSYHFGMNHEAGSRPGDTRPPQLFDDDHIEEPVRPRAAVSSRNVGAQQTLFAPLAPNGPRHDAVTFPLPVERDDLRVDEAPDIAAKQRMLLEENSARKHPFPHWSPMPATAATPR